MAEQLVVPVQPGNPTIDTSLVRGLIADAGDQAVWHYIDFFTANTATRTQGGRAPVPARVSLPGANRAD